MSTIVSSYNHGLDEAAMEEIRNKCIKKFKGIEGNKDVQNIPK